MRRVPDPPSEDSPINREQPSLLDVTADIYRRRIKPEVYNIASLVGGAACVAVSPAIEHINHDVGAVAVILGTSAIGIGAANLLLGRNYYR